MGLELLWGGGKYCIYFGDNSLLFSTVKEFLKIGQKLMTFCEKFDITFFRLEEAPISRVGDG